MTDIAIRVDELSKQYHIGVNREKYHTLRDTLTSAVTAPFRRAKKLLSGQASGAAELDETIWALRKISFQIAHGEVVAIIGPNGAGKSTLLKILSRITRPTEGSADVYGRVGSLLEVGTGFHMELTGRENIYLNGAILGMRREEIDAKFDEIVEFSGVERFIDTPVKHYSSGMGLRLGFAVAAHLEPEILMVDEVLAVGDAAFQQKCIGKMSGVASEGRTVLFVSHNMAAVKSLCSRGILLGDGEIRADGSIDEVVDLYLGSVGSQRQALSLADRTDRIGSGKLHFTGVELRNRSDLPVDRVLMGEPITFLVHYQATNGCPLENVQFSIRVEDLYANYMFMLDTYFTAQTFQTLPSAGSIRCEVPSIPLMPGEYKVRLNSEIGRQVADRINDTLRFHVEPADVFGVGGRLDFRKKHGLFYVHHSWSIE